ncbi:MAG: LemA family protein [Clostridiales bacterium]|nr:LemA family protein [Clostridiales bacterium]
MWKYILAAVVIILILIVVWYIRTYNKIRSSQVKINETLSGIDIALTKRYDMLSKLLDITKAYANHEKFTLIETIKMRAGMTASECSEVNSKLDEIAKSIHITAEAYPELKSSENFKQLQITVADVEEHLSASRRAYNANVSAYNRMLVTFPSSIVANSLGAEQADFFQAESEKREDVKMDFSS